MSNVRNFGAAGDGQTDDTEAIRHAVQHGDGVLEFSTGTYRLTSTIEIPLAEGGPLAITDSVHQKREITRREPTWDSWRISSKRTS